MNKKVIFFLLIVIIAASSSFTNINFKNINEFFLAISITTSDAIVLSDESVTVGGESITGLPATETVTERGTFYSTTSGVTTSSTKVIFSTEDNFDNFDHTIVELQANEQYYYKAYVTTNLNTVLGSEKSFWTFAVEPAGHPSTFSATEASSSEISLMFEKLDDYSGGGNGYILIRTDGGLPFDFSSIVDGVDPTNLSGVNVVQNVTDLSWSNYTDSGLSPSTEYSYAIIPYNLGDDDATYNYLIGDDDNGVAVKTATATTDALPVPTILDATSINADGFTINWNDESEADSYNWDVSEASDFSTTLAGYTDRSTNSTGSAIAEAISGLNSGVTYYFRVRSIRGTFEGDYATSSQITTPAVPTGMEAILPTSNGFTLQWDDVTGATSYDVQISTSGASEGAFTNTNNLIVGFNPANTTTNSLIVSDPTKFSANNTYYFRVKAKNGSLESDYSAITSATTATPFTVYMACTDDDLTICSGDYVKFYAFGADDYEFSIESVVQTQPPNSPPNELTTNKIQNGNTVTVKGSSNSSFDFESIGPFTVHDLPSTNLTGANPSFFVSDNAVPLAQYINYDNNNDALSISGTGVIKKADGSYEFHPDIAGEANHEITYTVKSPENCVSTETLYIDVFAGALTLSSRYCSNLDTARITVNLEGIPGDKLYKRLKFIHNGTEIVNPSVFKSISADNIQYELYPSEVYAANIDSIEVQVIVTSVDECDARYPGYPSNCDAVLDDPCHPDNPTFPANCGCTICGVCDPDYDAGDPADPDDQYPESCSTVMNNPCHPHNPTFPLNCDDCDSRNPDYPHSCDAVMSNPCHPKYPSDGPETCGDCDTRNPDYPFSCENVMDNPCHPDNPTYPNGCNINPDPCLYPQAQRIPIDCQLQRQKMLKAERIARKSSQLLSYQKTIFPQLTSLAADDEEVFQTKQTVIAPPEIGEVTSLNEFYCSNSEDIQLEGSFSGVFNGENVKLENGRYYFTPSTVLVPDGEAYVTDTLLYTYRDNGGCQNTIEAFVKVYTLPPTPIVDDIVLCQGDALVNFEVQNAETNGTVTWYRDEDLTIPVGSGKIFNSGLSTTSPGSATFYVTQGVNGCQSLSATVNILVNALPNDLVMHGLSNATYCNDYKGQIPLIAEPAPVAGNSAAFIIGNAVLQRYDTIAATVSDDGTQGVASFSPADFGIGVYKIHYRFINENGCVDESAAETVNLVNFKPTIDFGVSRIREGEETFFKGDDAIIANLSSAVQVLDSVFWDFGGEAIVADGDNIDSIYRHQFSGAGVYDVTYSIMTKSFCSGQITKKVGIFPVIEVSDESFYSESFESSSHGWIESEELELGNASSWSLSTPQGDTIVGAASGVNAWITNAGVDASGNPNNSYNKSEDSWIEGPCFYISDLSRPVLSLKIWSDTEDGFDGAVVEYSIGDTTQWNTLGSIEEGLEWYNTQGLVGSPGNQSGASFGWSGKLHSDWTLTKFPLDEVRVEAGGKPVRFRVAFASTSDNPFGKTFDGFAFDDFTIESRNRVVLLEHFTNISSTESRDEDGKLRSFVEGKSPEVIDIQYHTSFPGTDPLNKFNKADPSARALHYAIAEVPRTVMDGIYGVYYKNEPFFRESWGVNAYNTRALISAPFNIDISLGEDVSTTLEVTAEISKNVTAEAIEGNLIVQLAIVERQVTVDGNTYYNVVRRLLPNAAGNRLFDDWQPQDARVEQVVQTWNPAVDPGDSEFMVVASLYNEKSKEIYQAAYMSIPANKMPPMAKVTGVDDLLSKEGISLFPNPTEKEINILFPAPLREDYTLTVYDLHGVEVYRGTVKLGSGKATLNTEAYSSGVYSIRLNSSSDQVIRRFVKK